MRTMAKFSFSTNQASSDIARNIYLECRKVIENWLDKKGDLDCAKERFTVTYPDGRTATLENTVEDFSNGSLTKWSLKEKTSNDALFETSISLGCIGCDVSVFAVLSAGSPQTRIAPVGVDVRCPRFVKDLLELNYKWQVGRSEISNKPEFYKTSVGGKQFARKLLSETRDVPIVAVSQLDGFFVLPEIHAELSRDLAATAIVAVIDEDASWEITDECAKQWSCFNGAIRIYWPGLKLEDNPLTHTLYTADRILNLDGDFDDAKRRIRNILRRKLLGITALSVRQSRVIDDLEDMISKRQVKSLHDVKDYEGVIKLYEDQNNELKKKNEQLQVDVDNLKIQLEYATRDLEVDHENQIGQATELPPISVREAVERAKEQYSKTLYFGEDVGRGIANLADNAGPPEKLLRFLGQLNELCNQLNQGMLGTSIVDWLTTRSCPTSQESEYVKNNPAENKKRRWDWGGGKRSYL